MTPHPRPTQSDAVRVVAALQARAAGTDADHLWQAQTDAAHAETDQAIDARLAADDAQHSGAIFWAFWFGLFLASVALLWGSLSAAAAGHAWALLGLLPSLPALAWCVAVPVKIGRGTG